VSNILNNGKFSPADKEQIINRWMRIAGALSNKAPGSASEEIDRYNMLVHYHEQRLQLAYSLRSQVGIEYNLQEIIQYRTAKLLAKYC